jgi:hypothetical protein
LGNPVAGVQLELVFQTFVAGFRFHVALPAKAAPRPEGRSSNVATIGEQARVTVRVPVADMFTLR